MMELERPDVGVEATRDASAAGLLYEHLLQTSAPIRHRLGVTAGTAVLTGTANANERNPAVTGTFAQQLSRTRPVTPRVPSGLRLQLIAPEPVTDRGRTDIAARGDLPNRETLLNELAQRVAIDAATSRVAPRMLRHQPVLVDPVRH